MNDRPTQADCWAEFWRRIAAAYAELDHSEVRVAA